MRLIASRRPPVWKISGHVALLDLSVRNGVISGLGRDGELYMYPFLDFPRTQAQDSRESGESAEKRVDGSALQVHPAPPRSRAVIRFLPRVRTPHRPQSNKSKNSRCQRQAQRCPKCALVSLQERLGTLLVLEPRCPRDAARNDPDDGKPYRRPKLRHGVEDGPRERLGVVRELLANGDEADAEEHIG